MKPINFHSLHLIDKLALLRQMAKDVEKQYLEQNQRFQNFIEEIDDCYPYDDMSLDEKIIELNYIMAKQDDLLEQIEIINEVVIETRAQLAN